MKIILKWLAQLNQWFENLTEPKRFSIALLYGMFPFMFFSSLAVVSNKVGFNIIALLWISIFVVAFRVWWLYGNLKSYLPK